MHGYGGSAGDNGGGGHAGTDSVGLTLRYTGMAN